MQRIRREGGIADALPADTTDEFEVVRVVGEIVDRLGPVDVLAVNAIGLQPEGAGLLSRCWRKVLRAAVPTSEAGWPELAKTYADTTKEAH